MNNMFVNRNKYGGYSTPCKSKLMNGEEIVCWLDLAFAKGYEPTKEKIYIIPTDFFMTAYMNRAGETKPKMYIKSWQEDLSVPQRSNGNGVEVQQANDPFANKTIKPSQAPKQVQQTIAPNNQSVTGGIEYEDEQGNSRYVDIKANDLPFY